MPRGITTALASVFALQCVSGLRSVTDPAGDPLQTANRICRHSPHWSSELGRIDLHHTSPINLSLVHVLNCIHFHRRWGPSRGRTANRSTLMTTSSRHWRCAAWSCCRCRGHIPRTTREPVRQAPPLVHRLRPAPAACRRRPGFSTRPRYALHSAAMPSVVEPANIWLTLMIVWGDCVTSSIRSDNPPHQTCFAGDQLVHV